MTKVCFQSLIYKELVTHDTTIITLLIIEGGHVGQVFQSETKLVKTYQGFLAIIFIMAN